MRIKYFIPLLLLIGCSPELQVFTDFDRDVEVHRLTKYNWLPVQQIESRNNPIDFNELTDKRIKTAVNEQLKDKGYVYSEDGAQLIVHYHVIIENKASVRTEPLGYYSLDTRRYDEGTLIIDFMDSRNCDLIWRGWAVSVLDDDKAISEKLIRKAVNEIFKEFPMSAAKEVTLP